jgi:hypothetical protein
LKPKPYPLKTLKITSKNMVGGYVVRVVGKRNAYRIFLENVTAINQLECSDFGGVI